MILLVDDERTFIVERDNVLIARNCIEAIEHIENNHPIIEELWLDHDLGIVNNKPHDIFVLIDYIEEKYHVYNDDLNIQKVIVHTANPVGAERIMRTMSRMFNTKRVQVSNFLHVI